MPKKYEFCGTRIFKLPGATYFSPAAVWVVAGNQLTCPPPVRSASARTRVLPTAIHVRPWSYLARAISSLNRRSRAYRDFAHTELCRPTQKSGIRDISMLIYGKCKRQFVPAALPGRRKPERCAASDTRKSNHNSNLVRDYYPGIKTAFNLYFCSGSAKHSTSISLESFMFLQKRCDGCHRLGSSLAITLRNCEVVSSRAGVEGDDGSSGEEAENRFAHRSPALFRGCRCFLWETA